jgi:hypothetical protein
VSIMHTKSVGAPFLRASALESSTGRELIPVPIHFLIARFGRSALTGADSLVVS